MNNLRYNEQLTRDLADRAESEGNFHFKNYNYKQAENSYKEAYFLYTIINQNLVSHDSKIKICLDRVREAFTSSQVKGINTPKFDDYRNMVDAQIKKQFNEMDSVSNCKLPLFNPDDSKLNK
jgi:hypothetical protein